MTSRRALHDGWSVRALPGQAVVPPAVAAVTVAAEVPGCVHTDLMAAGLIADPLDDSNETAVAWVGRADWLYSVDVDWQPDGDDQHELVFEGLDTVAAVTVNGHLLARTANMHRSYRLDVTDVLTPGPNRVEVAFTSAWTHAEAERARIGPLPGAYPTPYLYIRKMACSFGWDWGPTTVSCGIWRPVWLCGWSGARLDAVRPFVTVDGSTGVVRVDVDLVRAGPGTEPLSLTATLTGPGAEQTTTSQVVDGSAHAQVGLAVPDVQLWWPVGHGEQPLYELRLELRAADGSLLDEWTRRVGFRDVRLDTSHDDVGSAFTFVVNGRPLFAKGVNWIPDDAFPSRVDRDRYRERITQARDAGVNLLRVWGGGLYESEDFYELCDELGLLVWQDFLFACAAYPEEPDYAAEVEAEAREAVTRLMPHPSVALWNGNNENIWGWFDWGWQEALDGRPWGRGYYLDLLPRVVAQTDPTTPYWPGSPYAGSFDLHPNDPRYGPSHVWDVWNEKDYAHYRDQSPRFVAEFGWQAPATWATLAAAVHDDPLATDSPGLRHHQKADDGDAKLARGLASHFALPATVEDWHFLTQVNQARAVTLGVEHFRSRQPTCMGTVWWQLNDCWPAVSWSLVDSAGRRKPAWYALRRSYAPRLLTVQPRAGSLAAVLVNDTGPAWDAEVVAERFGLDGDRLASTTRPVRVDPYGVVEVGLPAAVAIPGRPEAEVVRVSAGGSPAWWWFAPDRDLALVAPSYDSEVSARPGGYEVRVTAHVLLRDLCLLVDRLDPRAAVDDMFVTLLPGESVDLHVDTAGPVDASALVARPVLRSVNDVVSGAGSR